MDPNSVPFSANRSTEEDSGKCESMPKILREHGGSGPHEDDSHGGSDDYRDTNSNDSNNGSKIEEKDDLECRVRDGLDEFKKKAVMIIEEHFATDDAVSTANELKDLGWPCYHYYFVKKLISTAMDRHDKEKEMAAALLSTLYAQVIEPAQVYKGFSELVISCDDLCVDIPYAVDVLALFTARAVVDDILPPAFLMRQMAALPVNSKGVDVVKKANKAYLSAPLHAENVLHRWGGSKSVRVEDVKTRIKDLLTEYVVSADTAEACRCIKDLKLPFFHHEIVKQALVMAMERSSAKGLLLDLLKEAAEEGSINQSQMTKGFARLIDVIDDLSLDIPRAKQLLQSLISDASSEGWLCSSSLKSISTQPQSHPHDDDAARLFKPKATLIVQEYFLAGDILEVINSLESEAASSPECNAIFVKRLITLAMGRKNREKEMASVLLPSMCFSSNDILSGFFLLIDSAEDAALDNPSVVEDLSMFLARAVVDEAMAPSHLDELGMQSNGNSPAGDRAIQMAQSLLRAPLSSERILRCWGGGGSDKPGWEIEDVKNKITRLLEEYQFGGDLVEACRCIKELGMPFFHHEVVKKTLVTVMEKKNERLWGLLGECFTIGLITPNQMTKGFERVADCIDDLMLDIPDVRRQYDRYVMLAKEESWLEDCFPSPT